MNDPDSAIGLNANDEISSEVFFALLGSSHINVEPRLFPLGANENFPVVGDGTACIRNKSIID